MKNFYEINRALAAKKKLFTFLLALMVGTDTLLADTGVLNYTFDVEAGEATIVKPTSGVYTGEIVVPTSAQNPSNSIYYPVRHIGESAFANSTVTKVFLPEGLYTIGAKAFWNCDNLTSLSIPSTVTEVACDAFDGSKLLTEFVFYPVTPPAITGTSSAPQLQKKADIYIPDDAYDAGAYSSAWGGGNFTFQPLAKNKVQVGELYYHFNLCSKQAEVRSGEYSFTSLTIPGSAMYDGNPFPVTSIGKSAFRNLTNLKSVTLSNGMEKIGDAAFMQTSVTTLYLPASLTTIGAYAFAYPVESTINITCDAEEPPVCGEYCFYLMNTANSKLTVPVTGYDAYKNTEPWSAFGKIEYNDEFTQGDFMFKLDGDTKTASLIAYNKSSAQTEVTIPNELILGKTTFAVTSIAAQVFANCTSITSVVIPDNVTVVGYQAFAGCTALNQVTLPATIPSISRSCFENCTALPVTNGIRYADYMLLGPTDLTKTTYTISSTTRLIADYAFYGCNNMTLIVLPDNVEKIGYGAFYKCAALASISVPQTVKEIGQQAFLGCTSLKQVKMAAGLKEIGWRAFAKCSALQQIDLPEGLEIIGGQAFHRCASLKQCTIPASVNKMQIGEYVELPGDEDDNTFVSTFSKCDALDTIVILSKTIGEAAYLSQYFDWYIPNYVLGENIEKVGHNAFTGTVDLNSVQLSSSIKTICKAAFSGQYKLPEIDLRNVTTIEDSAFYWAIRLEHITLNHVEAIGKGAFVYTPLKELHLPACLKTIGEKAFSNCLSLQSITCEATEPPVLGDQCFSYSQVKDIPVTVPAKSVTAYRKAPGWTEFNNYQVIQTPLRYEFRDDNLTATVIVYGDEDTPYCGDVVIPATVEHDSKTYTVTTIGRAAFLDCTELTSISIPPTVQNIYTNAFWGCTNLQAVNISDLSKWCTVYISVENPLAPYAHPLTYSQRLMLNDEEINDLVIPDEATLVNSYAFANDTALVSVTIPASMSVIQTGAFMGCKNIKTITCYANDVPFTNMYTFDDIDKKIPVYVPAESVEAYKTTGEWQYFTNILPLPPCYYLVDLSKESVTAGEYIIVFDDNKAHAAVSGKDLIASSDELEFSSDGNYAFVPEEAVCAVTIAPLGTDSFSILLADGTSYMDQTAKNSVTTSANPSAFAITDGGDQYAQISKTISDGKSYVLKHNGNYFRMYNGTVYTLPKLYRKKIVKYTITWKMDDGTVIDQTKVEAGVVPTHADPTKAATAEYTYTFAGWDPKVVAVTGDATYTATFTATKNSYTVTFVDWDGTELKKEAVEYGKAATAPADPTRAGYRFTGWDKAFDHIIADLTVTAQYEAIDYTPTNLKADLEPKESDLQITLSWDKVEGAASYELRLVAGEKELFSQNTMGLNVISSLLSVIEKTYSIDPGTYTMSWAVRSTDAMGKAISDWAAGPQFEITIKGSVTGVENVQSDNVPCTKVLRNGMIFILRDGKTYTVTGQEIK